MQAQDPISPGTPSEEGSTIQVGSYRKRRTLLACQRCKSRKQKCDGARPSCSTCRITSAECRYVPSTVPKPSEQRVYIKALKERVEELEKSLAIAEGLSGPQDPGRPFRTTEPAETPLARTIRDLTLNASGYSYLGGSSNISLARLLEPVLHREAAAAQSLDTDELASADPLVTRNIPLFEAQESDILPLSDPSVEEPFQAYLEQVCTYYPVISSRKLREIHARRSKPKDLYEVCLLRLVYAVGGVTLELAGIKGNFKSEQHYEAAMAHRAKMIHYIDRRSIRYLALASIYVLRSPRSFGPWTMTGLAVKLCISFGLHRRACTSRFGIRSELDKRLFWTCYILDRDVTFTMGRPPSICDHDIDIQLPLDVNEDSMRPDEFRNAMARDPGLPADPPTTLTRFIHLVRLKRIGSRIQHTIYRVDRPIDSSENKEEAFLQQIEDWRERIPKKHQEEGPNNLLHNYMAQYHSCIRFLLFARLTEETVNPRFFEMGVQACIGVCKAFKRVHQQCITNLYTPMTTMSLFLAGFTLLYCHWRSPEAMAMPLVHDALTDCTIMLYVMTERWRPAEKYRKAFECLKQLIVDRNSQQDHATVLARNIPLEPETRTTLDGIHQDLGIDAFSQMIMEVTGGDYADRQGWDATAFQTTFEDDAHAFDDSEAYEFDPLMSNLSFWDAAAGDPEGFFAR